MQGALQMFLRRGRQPEVECPIQRVHNGFGGMRDLAYFEGEIRNAS